jgi:hypothetical protein
MNLEGRKLEFIQDFLKVQNEDLISRLEKILQKEINNLDQENFTPMSREEYNIRIDASMSDSDNGRLIKAEDLKAKIEK